MTSPDPFAPLLDDPRRAAVVADFDGSLAPIVEDPRASRPLPAAVDVLGRLVALAGCTAVVSGRPVSFLRRVLPVPGLVLAGLYGMERLVDDEVVVDAAAEPFVGVAEQAAAEADRALRGLYVERKGGLTCVIHWRTAPDRGEEATALGHDIARRHGLVAQAGRMSLELRPPVDVDKGTAVEELVAGMRCALFAGDDLGDVDAFEALDRMVAAETLGAAVKVAVLSPEAPPELVERADERVDGPEALASLLSDLADAMEAPA